MVRALAMGQSPLQEFLLKCIKVSLFQKLILNRRRPEVLIRETNKEIGYKGVDWIHLLISLCISYDKIKEDGMGWAGSVPLMGDEKCTQNFGRETRREKTTRNTYA
jgi:hypothetical protein